MLSNEWSTCKTSLSHTVENWALECGKFHFKGHSVTFLKFVCCNRLLSGLHIGPCTLQVVLHEVSGEFVKVLVDLCGWNPMVANESSLGWSTFPWHCWLCYTRCFYIVTSVCDKVWWDRVAVSARIYWKLFCFAVNVPPVGYCTLELTQDNTDALIYAVKNHYWYQMYIGKSGLFWLLCSLVRFSRLQCTCTL